MQPFDRVVEEHGAAVLRVCTALLGPEEAQDAWSETFLAALRAYPRLRPDSNLQGWLVTIAHNKAMDALRRRSRAPVPAGDGTDLSPPGTAAAGDDPAQAAVGRVDCELLAAVRALPPKQQAAVVHHYLADLPYREVAAALGTSPAAARRSAADGVAALRIALGPAGTAGEPTSRPLPRKR
ncbi:MAG: sigma-70 family RNA polymerase sigma factor [Acidimicrobiales bacterium]